MSLGRIVDNYLPSFQKQNTFIFYHFEVQKYKTHKITKLFKLELYKFFTHVVSIFTANSCSIKQTLIKLESPIYSHFERLTTKLIFCMTEFEKLTFLGFEMGVSNW